MYKTQNSINDVCNSSILLQNCEYNVIIELKNRFLRFIPLLDRITSELIFRPLRKCSYKQDFKFILCSRFLISDHAK